MLRPSPSRSPRRQTGTAVPVTVKLVLALGVSACDGSIAACAVIAANARVMTVVFVHGGIFFAPFLYFRFEGYGDGVGVSAGQQRKPIRAARRNHDLPDECKPLLNPPHRTLAL